jgi:hypothetical protein
MSVLTQSREESIRLQAEMLRTAARAKGSFLKPVSLKFGAWGVVLSFGAREEMERLNALENVEREQRKLPRMDRGRAADTWHMSVRLIVPEEVIQKDAFDDLGMLAAAVGVPQNKLMAPIETLLGTRETVHWQWRDE